MESIREVQRKYCSKAMTWAIVVGLAMIVSGQTAVAKGLILGTIFSAFNFVLMGATLPLKLGKSQPRAVAWSLASLLLRYAVLAIPVIAAVKFRQLNLFAVIGGIFMVQMVIVADSLLMTLTSLRNKQT